MCSISAHSNNRLSRPRPTDTLEGPISTAVRSRPNAYRQPRQRIATNTGNAANRPAPTATPAGAPEYSSTMSHTSAPTNAAIVAAPANDTTAKAPPNRVSPIRVRIPALKTISSSDPSADITTMPELCPQSLRVGGATTGPSAPAGRTFTAMSLLNSGNGMSSPLPVAATAALPTIAPLYVSQNSTA